MISSSGRWWRGDFLKFDPVQKSILYQLPSKLPFFIPILPKTGRYMFWKRETDDFF